MTSFDPSWPEAFVERIRKQFPDIADSFLESLHSDAGISVRINSVKFQAKISSKRVPWCTTGYFLEERPLFALDPLWHAGAYYVQEASSMFLEQVFEQINADHPLLVLDLCAAPGGKSTHLSSLLKPDDFLVSNEVIRSRLPVLTENLTKWGHSNNLICSSDARQFGDAGALFDVLVIDAPCSGEGLFRRSPEAATEWSVENAALCAVRQRRILADSWACLKNSGYLIYSTCTFNPAENEENLHWLRSQGNFTSIPVPLSPEWNIDETEYEGIYGYRFLPSNVKGEGFFIALLQKNEETPPFRFSSKFKTRLQKSTKIPADWIKHPDTKKIFQHQDQLRFIPARWENEILYLFETVNVIKAGTTAGQLVRNDVLPDHELAMSLELNQDAFPVSELQQEDALKYIGRNPFNLKAEKTPWQLVTFRQIPLGFIKNLGNRFNNYYPKAWRLRMQADATANRWYDQL
ncbi:MAG: RNA methyltransferase [Mangrovibacterium sp.]